MIIEMILFRIFVLVGVGDCWSTAKILRYNHKYLTDKKFARHVRYVTNKIARKDESKVEMSSFGRKVIQKYGSDRAMLYIFVFGYEPIAIIFLYLLVNDFSWYFFVAIIMISFMLGILYRQIWRAAHMNKMYGVKL